MQCDRCALRHQEQIAAVDAIVQEQIAAVDASVASRFVSVGRLIVCLGNVASFAPSIMSQIVVLLKDLLKSSYFNINLKNSVLSILKTSAQTDAINVNSEVSGDACNRHSSSTEPPQNSFSSELFDVFTPGNILGESGPSSSSSSSLIASLPDTSTKAASTSLPFLQRRVPGARS